MHGAPKKTWILMLLVAALFVLAAYPEPPARLLTPAAEWVVNGPASSKVPLPAFPEQYRQLRRSVVETPDGQVFRTWTPDHGNVTIDVASGSFRPTRYMSVAITGGNRTPAGRIPTYAGRIQTYIECEDNGQRLDIFRGGVNVGVVEAVVVTPPDWCAGNARLRFTTTEADAYVGVGSVFEISQLSWLKAGFLGLLPYFLTALAIFSLVMLAGAALAVRWRWQGDPLPAAFAALGLASLGVFYLASGVLGGLYSANPATIRETLGIWGGASITIVALATLAAFLVAGRESTVQAARLLAPGARVWGGAALAYFALLAMASNGVGHWEPNYRFWPATWSSDNELPWMFADAIRHGGTLAGLFGGGWMPTDRPPLMAGAHLLLADAFGWLQSGNDGAYLRGQAYNVAALTLNALWVPAAWWLLTTLARTIDARGRTLVLLFVGSLPFAIFNTIYGWPKAFGAAFALLSFGLAWQARDREPDAALRATILLFFVLGAFSMLAHTSTALFLAPLGLFFLGWVLRRNFRSVVLGFFVALALLASWSLYKKLVLPSADPVTRYALTGDYGFGHPDWSLWKMLLSRYAELGFGGWLELKQIMLQQAFLPIHHSITQIGLNADYGAGSLDLLRAWDFMLLSKGNVAVPLFALVALWVLLRAALVGRRDANRDIAPFLLLVGVSSIAWALLVLGFVAPPVVHHWPQAALFGLALGGALVVHERYPALFIVALYALLTYTGVVWIFSPLQSALAIDAAAAVVFAGIVVRAILSGGLTVAWPAPGGLPRSGSLPVHEILLGMKDSAVLRRFEQAGGWMRVLQVLAVVALLFSAYYALRYSHQPLADAHAYRQTQTALTAYWMVQEGWQLAYQTPVAGFPWEIPFEFPLYQAIVAGLSSLTGFELGATGRLVSYLFLLACCWPAFAISRRLDLPRAVPWVFCALLLTSPLNVYWGRTFMIETAALFFTLACLPFAIDLVRGTGGWRSIALFFAFATAGVLQKSTTTGPVLLFLAVAATVVHVRQSGVSVQTVRRLLPAALAIGGVLAVGLAWAHYADLVKMANPFGKQLTSRGLATWNFGTLAQRLDPATWARVIWGRSLSGNAGGWLGVMLLLLPWVFSPAHRRYAWLSLVALTIFVLPLAIFTNLHFVHEYYQVACVAFLLAALAVVIGGWLPAATGVPMLAPLATLAVMLLNVSVFHSAYGLMTTRTIGELDPRSQQSFNVGQYLRTHTRPGEGLVIFGQSYSSEVAYQAQRKSMTADHWFTEYAQVWDKPEAYLGGLRLGAIVVCPVTDQFPTRADIDARLAQEPHWIQETVNDCEILLAPNPGGPQP